jgi:hypothetical protein
MKNTIQDAIEFRLKAGNSYCHIIQSKHLCILDFYLRNLKIKIHKTIIWAVVLYDCETCSLTLREQCRLRVFENRNLRRMSLMLCLELKHSKNI